MMSDTRRPFFCVALLLLCLALVGSACTDDGGGDEQPEPVPCNGACPAEECVFNVCQGDDPNPDMNPGMDAGLDAEPEPEDAEEDVDPEDVEMDAEPEPEDVEPEMDAPEDEEVLPPQGCMSDGDCPEGSICDDDFDPPECRVGCRDSSNCPDDTVCSPELELCVAGCADDDDCLEGEFCDEVSLGCVGLGCDDDAACGPLQYCDIGPGPDRCTVGCRTEPDNCREDFFCEPEGRSCEAGCAEDEVCPEGQYCDLNLRTCREGCREDDECLGNEVCEEIRIENEPPVQACVPPDCDEDRDCGMQDFCAFDEGMNRSICTPGCRIIRDNCPRGFACNPNTRECDQEGCLLDSDCPQVGQICVEGEEGNLCQIGCREDEQCAPEQICQLDFFLCSCEVPGECAQGQTCDQNLCVPACRFDSDCQEGETCDLEFEVCVFGCRDDFLEPNDELFEASVIERGDIEALRMCYQEGLPEDSRDCYRLDVFEDEAVGSTLQVSLTFSHEDGDLNLFLQDPDFNEAGRSESTEDGEQVSALIEFPGAWHFCVEPAGDFFRSGYSINSQVIREE